MKPEAVPSMRERVTQLAFNGALFGLCYPLANHLAARAGVTRSVALPWDAALPFLPWMVLPYMTSGPLFVLSFLLASSRAELSALSRRVAFATVAACLVFASFPLRFAFDRPAVDAALPAWLFAQLTAMDQPYNQLPSLHVAYCVIFWPALSSAGRRAGQARSALPRALLAAWLLLVAAATVFTYQHHLADVAGGALLGLLAIRALPVRASAATATSAADATLAPGDRVRGSAVAAGSRPVTFCYALMAGLALLAWFALGGPWWLYLGSSLLLVARAYHRRDAAFLHKRNGRYPLWVWLLYAPYLGGYLLTWQLVRWRERHKPPFDQAGERLWVGRRLSDAEAARLPAGCAVIDLSNELSETRALRGGAYQHFPLLDLHALDARAAQPILAAIATHAGQGRNIYLHCAMGYARSRRVAQLYKEYSQQ
jgi:membrane-associated phospholipid phosphatase